MGEMVDGQGELNALTAPAWLAMTGVLQPCIQHQSIDRLLFLQQRCAERVDLLQVGEVGLEHTGGRIDPVEGFGCPLVIAADQGESVPLLFHPPGCMASDPTGGARDQHSSGFSHRCEA